jgi:hypothetical protein
MPKLTVFLLLLLLASPLFFVAQVHGQEWLEGWRFRQPFFVESFSEDFQASLTFDKGSQHLDSVRVTAANGLTLVPIWNQTEETVWARFPTANATYYVYWGNSEAEPVWNKTAVFINVIDGVVLALPFDEGEGDTAFDYSGYGNDGTLVNSPEWVDGKYGGALSFDGVDNYVEINESASLNITEAITVSLWLRFNQIDINQGIIRSRSEDGNNPWNVWYWNVGKFRFEVFIDGGSYVQVYTDDDSVTLGDWIHFIGVFDGVTLKTYLNGVEQLHSLTAVGSIYPPDSNVRIGEYYGYFKGLCDEVRIYNRALSAEEIGNIYGNYGDPTLATGEVLVRKWIDADVMFGARETADITGQEAFDMAAGLVIMFFCVGLAVTVALVSYKRKPE